jgi:hypothetical protein
MHFFFHLFTGILLGLLLADIFGDEGWLIPCAVGAILPDLVDKPVGYVLLPGVIGYGRFLFHSLPVAMLILAAGIVLWRRRGSVVVLAVATGVIFHQFLDTMWRQPAGWLDPLLGPVTEHRPIPPDYFFILLRQNFEDPWEIFLGCVLVVCELTWLERDRIVGMAMAHRRGTGLALEGMGLFLGVLSGAVLLLGVVGRYLGHRGPPPDLVFIFTVVFAIPSLLALRWAAALGNRGSASGA